MDYTLSATQYRYMESNESVELDPRSEVIEIETYDTTLTVNCWTAYDSNMKLIHIESALRKVTYSCPDCEQSMIAVKGEKLSHHFRHLASKDETNISCGGEGFKHLRVKLFLTDTLRLISNEKYLLHGIKIQSEQTVENERPDIVITVGGQDLLAIEIVDTHPPSNEKIERWKSNLEVINITDWPTRAFVDTAMLSAKLLPRIAGFSKFMESVIQIKSHDSILKHKLLEKRNEMEEKLVSGFVQKERELNEKFEKLEKSLTQNLERKESSILLPTIWQGSFRTHEGEWGVRVQSNRSTLPLKGDIALVVQNKDKKLVVVVLGKQIVNGKRFDTDGPIFWSQYEIISRRIDEELQNMLAEF